LTSSAAHARCCGNGKGYGCNYFSSETTNTGSAETTDTPSPPQGAKIIINFSPTTAAQTVFAQSPRSVACKTICVRIFSRTSDRDARVLIYIYIYIYLFENRAQTPIRSSQIKKLIASVRRTMIKNSRVPQQ